MPHQDRKSREIVVNHQALWEAWTWLLPSELFTGMHARKGSAWKPRMLAFAALFWATSDRPTLGERFDHARKIITKVFRGQSAPGKTYEGFLKMLRRWNGKLLPAIVSGLRLRMVQELPEQFQIAGFTVMAGDGSRVGVPRTQSNQQAFSPRRQRQKQSNKKSRKSKRGKSRRKSQAVKPRTQKQQSSSSIEKKADMTQVWLTLLWHVGTGLPWSWRSGAADSSERHHLLEMLGETPENTLITADAGFVGYEFWKAVQDAGLEFVIRVGGNVKLIKQLGYARESAQTVYLWPDKAAKKGMPPLVLRLMELHDGKQPVYLVTSVLSKRRLSDRQGVEIYRCRWGIELYFRTFKQTFGRTKLRSRSAAHALLELDWSLVALWAISLLGQRELARDGTAPSRLSAAAAIRAIQTTMRDYRLRPESADETLISMLTHALLDDYERNSSKSSRDYPTKKKRPPTGPPKIVMPNNTQIAAATDIKSTNRKIRLAA